MTDRVWHPFSRPEQRAPGDGIVFIRGEGVWLWDRDGKRYLDGVGALEAMAIGHGRREMAEVASRQMAKLAFLDVFRHSSEPALALADDLVRIAPRGLGRVHFTPGGSEAVEVALKLAFQYHWLRGEPNRRRVICRRGAYHGVTIGAMNCDGGYYSTRNDIYLGNAGFGAVADGPATAEGWGLGGRHTAGAAGFAAAVAELGAENVAAIIVDPVATASGVGTPPPQDLRDLRALCDEHGILLICDEVISGFCRTGRTFASQHAGVVPDLMPLSKALSSGYLPIGATLVSDRVVAAFDVASPDAIFTHGHTYGGHPVACAVARENIRILSEEHLAERAEQMGPVLQDRLRGLDHHPTFIDARGIGLLAGLEVVGDDAEAGRFGSARAAAAWLRGRCRDRGLITLTVHPGTVLLLAPPLVIDEAQIDTMAAILDDALTDLEAAR